VDFRDTQLDEETIDEIQSLIIEGLISYQPFIFAEDLEAGVGYEFEKGHYAGLVHFPDMPADLRSSPDLARRLLPAHNKLHFRDANRRLAAYYDYIIDWILGEVGDASGLSFLDVGCNNGYLPLGFLHRNALRAAGCDRQDFSRVFGLLNRINGSEAEFIHAWYEPSSHRLDGVGSFDVVTSMAMLCHVSDPLHLLKALGEISRKALFVWTLFSDDEGNVVRYGDPRGDYPGDRFPYCFDNMTVLSAQLLRKSVEMMGFSRLVELPPLGEMPSYSWKGFPFRGFLAIRG
jgi:SAM-dependent methyltransferase